MEEVQVMGECGFSPSAKIKVYKYRHDCGHCVCRHTCDVRQYANRRIHLFLKLVKPQTEGESERVHSLSLTCHKSQHQLSK